jgi:hypothetical protein
MVNYHDPVVVAQDYCAHAFAAKYMDSGSQLTSFDSSRDESLACCGWTLLVCLPRRALDSCNISNNNNPVLISSWEFVTTLDYEWSVIRRHRPYRWSIWVCNDALFVLSCVARRWALD